MNEYVRYGIVESEDGTWDVVDLVHQVVEQTGLSHEMAEARALRMAAATHTRPYVSIEEFTIPRGGA